MANEHDEAEWMRRSAEVRRCADLLQRAFKHAAEITRQLEAQYAARAEALQRGDLEQLGAVQPQIGALLVDEAQAHEAADRAWVDLDAACDAANAAAPGHIHEMLFDAAVIRAQIEGKSPVTPIAGNPH